MKRFFLQFDNEDETIIRSVLSHLRNKGDVHEVLGTFYCFLSDSYDNTLELRDDILDNSDNAKIFVMEIPGGINSAWHLSVENSNWLKSVLDGK